MYSGMGGGEAHRCRCDRLLRGDIFFFQIAGGDPRMADHIFSSCCCFAMASLMRCYIHIACHDGESVSESLTPSSFFFSLAIETPSRRREKASVSEGTINIKKRGTFFAATDSPRSSVLCTCIGSASVSIASSSRDRFALAAAIGVDACCAKSLSSCLPALLFAKLFAAFLSYPAREVMSRRTACDQQKI